MNAIIKNNEPQNPTEEESAPVAELAPEISIDDFAKVDLRVAKVLECEKVKKSKKLRLRIVSI